MKRSTNLLCTSIQQRLMSIRYLHSFQTLTQNHRGFLFEKRKTIAMRKSIIVFFFFSQKNFKFKENNFYFQI